MQKKSFFCTACFAIILAVTGCATNSNKKEDQKMESKEVEKQIEVGQLIHFTYHSTYCGLDRGVNILIPNDYDEAKQYPVVYYLHGIFGNEYSMPNDPEVKNIVARYCANNKEIIVVFPDMFARKDFKQQPGFDDAAVACYDNFIFDLIQDLMPFIKSRFSILEGKENTALCGFSMGGRETLYIGLQHPEMFGYLAAFAPAPGLVPGKDYAMNHPGQLESKDLTFAGKEEPFYLQVSCGTVDNVVGQFPKQYHKIFEENGVEDNWFEIIGAGHDGSIYNPSFEKFLGEIFK